MGEKTGISWTDHTFNPWWGCSKVSPACDHCYAEVVAHRFTPPDKNGKPVQLWGLAKDGAVRRVFDDRHWNAPLAWNKRAEKDGVRRRVFCASMADVFDNHGNGSLNDEREDLWSLIHKTPWLDWQLLTKRIGNVASMVPPTWMRGHWPKNAWLGISVVNQAEAHRDIPKLLSLPVRAVRFISCEPLLEALDLVSYIHCDVGNALEWVIVGGESGADARPMDAEWVRSIRDQCKAAGVPMHFKQWGAWSAPGFSFTDTDPFRTPTEDKLARFRVGTKAAGDVLDGVRHKEFP